MEKILDKKWVFKELVQDESDAEGLIAYSLYKLKKSQLAQSLRESGKSDSEVEKQLETFHNHELLSGELPGYRKRAVVFLGAVRDAAEQELRDEFDETEQDLKDGFEIERNQIDKQNKKAIEGLYKQLRDLEKKHQNELKREKGKLLKNIENYQTANKSFISKCASWILSGMPSAVSTILITVLVLGALAFVGGKDAKQAVLEGIVISLFDVSDLSFVKPENK